jgi:hypothetical protein
MVWNGKDLRKSIQQEKLWHSDNLKFKKILNFPMGFPTLFDSYLLTIYRKL